MADSAHSPLGDVARHWIARLASGDITEEQMRELREWLAAAADHRRVFADEKRLWRQVEPLGARLAASLPSQLHAAGTADWPTSSTSKHSGRPLASGAVRVHAADARRRARWRMGVAGGALAACLVLAVTLGNPFTRLRADYTTGVGEITRATLPDGSSAVLNTSSAIAIHFTSDERRIDILKGEAWFDVRPNKSRPFRVHAASGVAEAVGTKFSVAERDDGAVVQVTKGIVAVSAVPDTSGHVERVTAGMRVYYSAGHAPTRAARCDEAAEAGWRDGRIFIQDQPLMDALAELDRYRPGHILLLDAAHADSRVSGVFTINALDPSLEGLVSTQGLHVTYLTRYLAIVR